MGSELALFMTSKERELLFSGPTLHFPFGVTLHFIFVQINAKIFYEYFTHVKWLVLLLSTTEMVTDVHYLTPSILRQYAIHA